MKIKINEWKKCIIIPIEFQKKFEKKTTELIPHIANIKEIADIKKKDNFLYYYFKCYNPFGCVCSFYKLF